MQEIPSFWGQNGPNEGPHDVTDPIPNGGFGVGSGACGGIMIRGKWLFWMIYPLVN